MLRVVAHLGAVVIRTSFKHEYSFTLPYERVANPVYAYMLTAAVTIFEY